MAVALKPAREVDVARAARVGLILGGVAALLGAIGLIVDFQGVDVVDGLGLGTLILVALPLLGGFGAASAPPVLEGYSEPRPGGRNLAAGAAAGVAGGALLAAFGWVVGAVDVREIFINVTPEMIEALTFGGGAGSGLAIAAVAWAVAGTLGASGHLLPGVLRRRLRAVATWVVAGGVFASVVGQILREVGLGGVQDLLYTGSDALTLPGAAVFAALALAFEVGVRPRRRAISQAVRSRIPESRRSATLLGLALVLLVLGLLPQILGQYLTAVANIAGIFLLLALGLNIVVGFAGLLNLGYVAFFAVGAYVTGVLTSPGAPGFAPELPFLLVVPIVLVAGAVVGLIVGTPVLRMRGDYLAIVTLGFGEIARLLAISDWLKPVLGGAQGITRIPNAAIGPITIETQPAYFITIFGLALGLAYASYALQNSRMGRAWVAMREDESVAEAMGVDIVAAKLWAFVLGSAFAALGGAFYASNIHSVFPTSFSIEQSIVVLVIVIVGGIASVPGVMVGALVLIALPEVLREFAAYRFLVYGGLLIFMMLRRPEGLIPSRRRALELHDEDRAQDAWLRKQTEDPDTPEPYTQPREV